MAAREWCSNAPFRVLGTCKPPPPTGADSACFPHVFLHPQGFAPSLNAILDFLPKKRQTLLFSATQTKRVKDLARLSLSDPEYIAVRRSPGALLSFDAIRKLRKVEARGGAPVQRDDASPACPCCSLARRRCTPRAPRRRPRS